MTTAWSTASPWAAAVASAAATARCSIAPAIPSTLAERSSADDRRFPPTNPTPHAARFPRPPGTSAYLGREGKQQPTAETWVGDKAGAKRAADQLLLWSSAGHCSGPSATLSRVGGHVFASENCPSRTCPRRQWPRSEHATVVSRRIRSRLRSGNSARPQYGHEMISFVTVSLLGRGVPDEISWLAVQQNRCRGGL